MRPFYKDYSTFSIDWFRPEKRPKQNDANIPAGFGFEQLCCDLMRENLKAYGVHMGDFISFETEQADGAIDFYALLEGDNKLIVECKKSVNPIAAKKNIADLKMKLKRNLKTTPEYDPIKTIYAP